MHVDLYPYAATFLCLAAIAVPPLGADLTAPQYTEKEREKIAAYWKKPGRYQVTPNALWEVRATPEASTFFHAYRRAVFGNAKLPPGADVRPALDGPYGEWERWISAKLDFDRWNAERAAANANHQTAAITITAAPPAPGPVPATLAATCGNPPAAFLTAVRPNTYRIAFDKPEDTFTYTDQVRLRERYGYYRFANGIVSYGTRLSQMPEGEKAHLFKAAGFSPAEQRIFAAISQLEGGFETVQTYDTGYVSIGFIQFVSLADGKHDLSEVLLQMKRDYPKEFAADFHRYGIDVRDDKTMVVIDPVTGAELSGNAAVMKIIEDKRLTAVFQRAGRRGPFRVAQIKVAKSFYWPQSDMLAVTLPDGTASVGKVGDVVKSEAGIATLLDRKINTGNIRSLPGIVQSVMAAHGCKTLTEAANYEKEIIAALKYRMDFLADATLAQPADPKPFPIATPTGIPSQLANGAITPLLSGAGNPTPTATPSAIPINKP
jgi:hypothetical protein